jgi:6-phosphogluconolactonase
VNIEFFHDLEALSRAAAAFIEARALKHIAGKNIFTMAISGGSTPQKTYALLAASPYRERLPWGKIYLFFVDERWVPADSTFSNFRLVSEAMLKFLPIPKNNIFNIPVGGKSAPADARQYEKMLKAFFTGLNFPVFDLVLMGMGTDGHSASLFPSSSALAEKTKWVINSRAPIDFPVPERITLTLPVLKQARETLFIISGKGKGTILQELIKNPAAAERYPAAHIITNPATTLFVDKTIFT